VESDKWRETCSVDDHDVIQEFFQEHKNHRKQFKKRRQRGIRKTERKLIKKIKGETAFQAKKTKLLAFYPHYLESKWQDQEDRE